MKEFVQTFVTEELVDEEEVAVPAALLRGAAVERDQVGVAQPRQDVHALVAVIVLQLHRHHAAVAQNAGNGIWMWTPPFLLPLSQLNSPTMEH